MVSNLLVPCIERARSTTIPPGISRVAGFFSHCRPARHDRGAYSSSLLFKQPRVNIPWDTDTSTVIPPCGSGAILACPQVLTNVGNAVPLEMILGVYLKDERARDYPITASQSQVQSQSTSERPGASKAVILRPQFSTLRFRGSW
jgi:hypothetical protein